VWSNGELVPVAKAYSGLSNAEITELDRWIRQHTLEKFGPVQSVEPVVAPKSARQKPLCQSACGGFAVSHALMLRGSQASLP
jgi:hypothetical protein